MQTRPRIALTVIARDEEDNLADLAASVSGQVDEMVLLDTGSVDGTVERARELGFIVGHRPWTDSFAEARNAAWELTDASWLLTLDCDERLVVEPNSPTLHQIVAQAQAENARGAMFVIVCPGKNDDGYITSVRLHRREGQHWIGRIHEQVVAKVPEETGTVVLNSPHIMHLGYLPEVMEAKGKAQRNLHLAERMYTEDTHIPQVKRSFELARAHSAAGSSPEIVEKLCLEALENPHILGRASWKWALITHIEQMTRRGELVDAYKLITRTDQLSCGETSLVAAQLALTLNLIDEARDHLVQAAQLPRTESSSPELFERVYNLTQARVYAVEGDLVAALDKLIEVNKKYPNDAEIEKLTMAIVARLQPSS